VTGSSSGIGKAIALTFAREGAQVIIAARRHTLCGLVAAQIRERGGSAVAMPTDVTDEAQVEQLIKDTARRFGRVDILVNNAGIGGGNRLAETRTNTFDRVMNTNLRGTFFCCRADFRQRQANGGGLILNMSSVAGVDAWAGTGTYSASKYGIVALTKALADEGRPHKIKVCAICPGGVADELVDAAPEQIDRSGQISPYHVAETAVYLAPLGPNAIVHRVIVDRLGAEW
jgi:3-oxoacyl-[acyl-carrier protein] reductase